MTFGGQSDEKGAENGHLKGGSSEKGARSSWTAARGRKGLLRFLSQPSVPSVSLPFSQSLTESPSPYIYTRAHVTPFHGRRRNIAAGLLLPFGLLLWWRIWHFRLRLLRDLKQIIASNEKIIARIDHENL